MWVNNQLFEWLSENGGKNLRHQSASEKKIKVMKQNKKKNTKNNSANKDALSLLK